MTEFVFNIYSMTYNVDKSLIGDGIIQYSTESGCKYMAKISESAPGSTLWSIDFRKLSGTPSPSEVFKIMKTLTDASMEYVLEKNINNFAIFIDGENEEIVEKKTVAFQRWLKDDWDFEVIKNMEIKISGMKNSVFTIPTNSIMMRRKQNVVQKQVSVNGNIQIKFCYNCGRENNEFQFCPNCGTNLKQA
jgi:hypothetical protein